MDVHLPATNLGYRMLTKMGWCAGQGLGTSQQGRTDPIRIDVKADSLGVGKLEEENYYHLSSTAKRKALDSEKFAEETEEERKTREDKVQKQKSIRQELETIRSAFYCQLCDKQYNRISEYEVHLSSYDHNHRKRFKEMKESNRPMAKLDKKRKMEQKREERELARMQQAAMKRAGINPLATPAASATDVETTMVRTGSNGAADEGGRIEIDSGRLSASKGKWTTVDMAAEPVSKGGWTTVGMASESPAKGGWTEVEPSASQSTGPGKFLEPSNMESASPVQSALAESAAPGSQKVTFGFGTSSASGEADRAGSQEGLKPTLKFGFKKR